MTIATRRVILVPYNESLLSDYIVLNCCVKNRFYLNGPYTVSKAKQEFNQLLNDNQIYARAVLDSFTHEYIGHIALSDLSLQPTLVFVFDKSYWGQGIAAEALGAFLKKARRDLSLTHVCAVNSVEHMAAIRVLQKLGFENKGPSSDGEDQYVEHQFTFDVVAGENARLESQS
ncbi:GNAT family N-acetyltransferase [Vibrio taketomensis]|uniref:GNAT family N-acetyltransferase n=1 Tax=Vibrio taketomensis TaxID=2572923 RepID=UPI001389A781|nr:GNAT family N-acetyltransferase [Vibrio taketomensis]